MELTFLTDEPDSGALTAAPADLYVQFESPDVEHDHFTLFWGGKRLDHLGPLADSFARFTSTLMEIHDKPPLYRTVIYTDRQKIAFRRPVLDLKPIQSLEGNIWFVRFELLQHTHQLLAQDAIQPRFIVWGRIGDTADAPSDSVGVWMVPADFRLLRSKVADFIIDMFPRSLFPAEVDASLRELSQKLGFVE